MKLTIRQETPGDYPIVESMTREAFWGYFHPTIDNEHFLVHLLRNCAAFVPELDLVAEAEGEIIGNVMYSMAKILSDKGEEIPVLTFGPLTVHPGYRNMGVGRALMERSIHDARQLGYRAIVFFGHPDYYPRLGFDRGVKYGIRTPKGMSLDALMAMPLVDGALDDAAGRFYEDPVFQMDPEEAAAFDKAFPPKTAVEMPPMALLMDELSPAAARSVAARNLKHLRALQGYSGNELLEWEDIGPDDLEIINRVLVRNGIDPKRVWDKSIYEKRP